MPRIKTETIDGKISKIGYKVVTNKLKSLGLRKNPNIHTYPISEWYFLPLKDIEPGNDDWVAFGFAGLWEMQKWCKSTC